MSNHRRLNSETRSTKRLDWRALIAGQKKTQSDEGNSAGSTDAADNCQGSLTADAAPESAPAQQIYDEGPPLDAADSVVVEALPETVAAPSTKKLNDIQITDESAERADILSREIVSAIGGGRKDMNWSNKKFTVGGLVGQLSKFRRSADKDGACLLQGELISNGQRTKERQSKQHILMLDIDVGMTLDDIDAALQKENLWALVWTTYSHGKSTSSVLEKKLEKYRKEVGAADRDAALMVRYLREEKGIYASVLEGATNFRSGPTDEGKAFFIDHQPLPKYRVLFVLSEPFDFYSDGLHTDRFIEWRERYAGVSHTLGIPYDKSCTDPSRLMYVPNLPVGAVVTHGTGYGAFLFGGDPLDLSKFPRIDDRGTRRDDDNAFTGYGGGGGADQFKFEPQTPHLKKFLALHGDDFQAATFCESVDEDSVKRRVTEDKLEVMCPNVDAHQSPDAPEGSPFFATNADDGSWTMYCQHDSCKSDSYGDRAWFLDQMCVQHGIKDAMALVEYCPSHVELMLMAKHEEEKRETHEADDGRDALKAQFAAKLAAMVPPIPDGADKDAALVLAKLTHVDDQGFVDRNVDELAKKAKVRVKTINGWIKDEHARIADIEAEAKAGMGEDDDDLKAPKAPKSVEVEKGKKFEVWSTWHVDARTSLALKRLKHVNAADPKIFSRPEGTVVRRITLAGAGDRLILEPMSNKDVWDCELMEAMTFNQMNETETKIYTVSAFPECITHARSTSHRDWPTIRYLSCTPLFGPDGHLYMSKGYHAKIETYINPNFAYEPPPEELTQADVDEAREFIMGNVLRDFPFSDSFGGPDPLPVKLDEFEEHTDEKGEVIRIRKPNMKRGRSSRAHAFAMILEPHLTAVLNGHPRPAFLINKAAAGTGAGFLIEAVQLIAEGQSTPGQSLGKKEEETKKVVTASLLAGSNWMIFDNIEEGSTIESDDFAMALTSNQWRDRILGGSTMGQVPNNAMWVFAGNDISLSEQLMRRVHPIYMDAAVPKPSRDRGREMFKHKPLGDWVKPNRPQLVRACHVLIQNWFDKGCPEGSVGINSFDRYTAIMGGVLEAAGVDGYLGNLDAYHANGKSDDKTVWDDIAQMWVEKSGVEPLTTAEVWAMLAVPGADHELVIDPWPGDRFKRQERQEQRLGKAVARYLVNKNRNVIVNNEKKVVSFEAGNDPKSRARTYRLVYR